MQRIQSMCAKLVLGLGKYESSKQALYQLHWLPIKARISFKILTYMFNCSVGHAPLYLVELLSRPELKRSGLRSNNNINDYAVPFNRNKTFSDRSFSSVGPLLWNRLPQSVRSAESVDQFKKRLKTFYFDNFSSLF